AEKATLEQFGYSVRTVAGGEEAVDIACGDPAIDLVLMDIDLGEGIDGTEAAERILRRREVPVVFLSAHTEPEYVERTEGITSYGYIVKNSGATIIDASIKMAFRLFEARQKQRLSEEALRHEKELLDHVFDSIREGISILDPDMTIRRTNKTIERWYAKDVPLEGKACFEVYQKRRVPCDRCPALRAMQSGRPEYAEVRFETGEGSKWIELYAHPLVFSGTSEVSGIVEFVRDVTDRKKAELAQKDYKDYLLGVLDALPDNVAVLDESGTIMTVNDSWRRFAAENGLHWEGHDGQGYNYLRTIEQAGDYSAEGARETADGIRSLLAGQRTSFSLEYPCHSPDEQRWFLMQARLFDSPQGKRVVVSHTNITAQKRAERDLEHSRARLLAMARAMPDVVLLLDRQGTYREVFSHREQLLYMPAERLQGRRVLEVLPREQAESILQAVHKTLDTRSPQSVEYSLEVPAGRRWFEARLAPVTSHDDSNAGEQVVLIARDVTERRHRAERVRRLLEQKELLLRETHHRIKNHLGAIAGLLSVQADELPDAGAAEGLRDAAGRTESISVLYDKLYRSERYEHLSAEEYIRSLVEETIKLWGPSRRVRGTFDIADIEIDVKTLGPLGLVLTELVTNSLKHAFAGEDGEISVELTRERETAALRYADNGPGLPESVSVEESKTFGLQLIRMLVEQIDGTLQVKHDGGATFLISFPLGAA
ncbi:MAG: PAS domain-containing protein, partial [Spirochaetaceae bacterium]